MHALNGSFAGQMQLFDGGREVPAKPGQLNRCRSSHARARRCSCLPEIIRKLGAAAD
jgi:hypothetical protein